MSLKKRIYSVLVVSATESFHSALASLLPESKYGPVRLVTGVNAAKRAVAERPYDFIFINSPLPDDNGIRFAIDLAGSRESVVLLLVRNDIHDEVYDEVTEHGVFTVAKPTAKQTLVQSLNWMASARERLRQFENRNLSIEKKMEEIRIVNRAKWLLISELKMSEPEAHRYIEKQAMDSCTSRRQIAEEIIRMYS